MPSNKAYSRRRQALPLPPNMMMAGAETQPSPLSGHNHDAVVSPLQHLALQRLLAAHSTINSLLATEYHLQKALETLIAAREDHERATTLFELDPLTLLSASQHQSDYEDLHRTIEQLRADGGDIQLATHYLERTTTNRDGEVGWKADAEHICKGTSQPKEYMAGIQHMKSLNERWKMDPSKLPAGSSSITSGWYYNLKTISWIGAADAGEDARIEQEHEIDSDRVSDTFTGGGHNEERASISISPPIDLASNERMSLDPGNESDSESEQPHIAAPGRPSRKARKGTLRKSLVGNESDQEPIAARLRREIKRPRRHTFDYHSKRICDRRYEVGPMRPSPEI